jgi:CheY-like chemotaxis protein
MKILIVDDELVSRKKMEKLIQSLGNETIIATDGLEAWEIWKKDRTRMVITDWLMPGMDGLDLCKKIRETEGDSYTYLIMVTSKRETGTLLSAWKQAQMISFPNLLPKMNSPLGSGPVKESFLWKLKTWSYFL